MRTCHRHTADDREHPRRRPRMRIAHVTDFYLPRLGGIEVHVHDLAERQSAAGHDVEIITSSPLGDRACRERNDRERYARERYAPDAGPRVHRLTGGGVLRSALNPQASWRGRRLLREGRYDLVHAHAGVVSPLALGAVALAHEIPVVVTQHSLLSYAEPAYQVLNAAARWSELPAVWTAVSSVAAEPVRRLVHPAPVQVLPNGIDAWRWRIDPVSREPHQMVVVAVMRLAVRKRPLPLLRILRQAHHALGDQVDLRAVIVGDGPERALVERFLSRHRMDHWVSLPGRLSRHQIRALFARADAFVAPATLESFGIAALEARCAGLPVIARAEGGIGEFISDGKEGILVGGDGAMAEAIVRLARDPAERERIMEHNRETPTSMDWSDVLPLTIELYERALRRERPRPARAGS
ncbi:glycosyltransferase family 4 protein [Actinomadura barringtoniae]|uniref:Glycosyltransferase family 4 protein n=1 Tax=Actinomadura barringtoniae TaxID=1427535 RepID=A0A939PIT5_9ACTN|nr:glycosyltransferase family 4 protein [Actinomadura barringtoniae]MBO2453200.1 glycosyltransferase family 4 protein [Actinomadura barringtoniae]